MGEGLRSLTNKSYSVRQSEEAINLLEKENFNLKLKLFILENKFGTTSLSNSVSDLNSTSSEKEYFELFIENETLKKDLIDKQEIMKNALIIIEKLEEEKCVLEKSTKNLIEEQAKKIDALKLKSKMFRKIKKVVVNPCDEATISRNMNEELKLSELKKELLTRVGTIDKLMGEKEILKKELEVTRNKLNNFETNMSCESDPNLSSIKSENMQLKENVKRLTEKCQKLEKKAKEFERLIIEQSSLMKALNRTIEAKNGELRDQKLKMEPSEAPHESEVINLARGSKHRQESEFPFHNPLFGNISSKYR